MGLEHLSGEWMEGTRIEDGVRTAHAVQSQDGRLADSCMPVVQGGIRHLQSGQLADHALELEYGLKDALRHLSLVRSIGGVELRTGKNMFYCGGDDVLVAAAAEEADRLHPVACRQGLHPSVYLELGDSLGNFEGFLQGQFTWNIGEQLLDVGDADRIEHHFNVLFGVGKISNHKIRSSSDRPSPAPRASHSSGRREAHPTRRHRRSG